MIKTIELYTTGNKDSDQHNAAQLLAMWNAAIEICIMLVKEETRISRHNKEMLIHRMGVAKQ